MCYNPYKTTPVWLNDDNLLRWIYWKQLRQHYYKQGVNGNSD